MRHFFVVATFQHVHGFNAKAGHVAGLPPLTAFNGFHGALSRKISAASGSQFAPTGLSVAFSRIQLREGQSTYAWTYVSRDAKGGRGVPAPMASQVEGDGVFHLIFGFSCEEGESLAIEDLERSWASMRLAGGEMPTVVGRQRKTQLEITATYDEALKKIPASAWVVQDAAAEFSDFLAKTPNKSGFAGLLAFTGWNGGPTDENLSSDAEVADAEKNGAEKSSEPAADEDAGASASPLENDKIDQPKDNEVISRSLSWRIPLVVGWRLLNEPEENPRVARFQGARTVMAEPVHGTAFLRLCAAIRQERRAEDSTEGELSEKSAIWFEWRWRVVAGRKAGLMVGVAP